MDKQAMENLMQLNERKEYIKFINELRQTILERMIVNDDKELFAVTCTPLHILQGQVQLLDSLTGTFDDMMKKVNYDYRLEQARKATTLKE